MKRLVYILFIPLFLLACGPAEVNLIPYTSENYPITFQMPEGWAINDNEDSISIASEEELLFSSVTGGARVNISVAPSLFTGTANMTQMVETAVRTFRDQEGTELIQDVELISINGQTAVQTVLRGQDGDGEEIILRYMIIENLAANQSAVVAAVHDASLNNEYGQLMADIVSSIQLGEDAP